MLSFVAKISSLLIPLLTLPLFGAWLAGKPLGPLLAFPPQTEKTCGPPFSLPLFLALAGLILAVLAPFANRIIRRHINCGQRRSNPRLTFPWWGRAGIPLTLLAWLLAWSRLAWFTPWQPFTFFPLWCGYIMVVNAMTWSRTGHCLLVDQPRFMVKLFLASGFFWWFFEYLNRFVHNWYYLGIEDFSALEYFLYATLPFTTVLPAVLSTRQFLAACQVMDGLTGFPKTRTQNPRIWGSILGAIAGAGLIAIGLVPNWCYPLLWITPLLLITSFKLIAGQPTVFAGIKQGDWQRIWEYGFAALICGFFWEMWNYNSLAKWVYVVPFVQGYHIFEMPLLGYAGYLPFGLECAAMVDFFWPGRHDF